MHTTRMRIIGTSIEDRDGLEIMTSHNDTIISFAPTTAGDIDELVAIRVAAMRESLERIGRFDPVRARERFQSGFSPQQTRYILLNDQRVGFVVVKQNDGHLLLDHLYLHPDHQGKGIGSAVLAQLFADAAAARLPIRVGALKQSEANRFYQQHGFVQIDEGEWDIYYERQAQ